MTDAITVTTDPFPHIVVDGWWDEGLLRAVLGEFPADDTPGWRRYDNGNERKAEGPPGLWGPWTRDLYAQIEARTAELERLFGVDGLRMETIGGGYHLIAPGGYLAVHADFNRSPVTSRFRRLNLLVYLNDDWNEPLSGGNLQLWNGGGCVVDIAPEFNRSVVFETSDHSWHGHPQPAGRTRRSVAAYFFTDEAPPGYRSEHSTIWHADA